MPQLIPFYFVNQLFYGFGTIILLTYFSALILLPQLLRIYIARIYISRL